MILETERLELRVIQKRDIPLIHQNIFSDKSVMKFALSETIFSLKETREFIDKYFLKDIYSKIGLCPIFLKDENKLIGLAGVMEFKYLNQREYEFGFIIAKKFQGQGYATEIGKAQINFAFNELKLQNIFALTNRENISSKNVLNKLKMKYISDINREDRGIREVFQLENINHKGKKCK